MSKNNDIERYTELIIETIADGIFTVDLNWKITSFNQAAREITGISKKKHWAVPAGKC